MGETKVTNHRAVRDRLLGRRRELEGLVDATSEARSAVELDQQRQGRLSRMDALQGQAMAAEAARRRKAEIDRIDAALKRLEAGEFGYCLACGENIPTARLDFDPAVTTCVDCARRGS
jgi:DnaK suppressor protein